MISTICARVFLQVYNKKYMETAKTNNNLFPNMFSSFQELPLQHADNLHQPISFWSFDEQTVKQSFQKTSHLEPDLINSFPSQCDLDEEFYPKTTLTLNHVTSFGKNVMENHGKKLSRAYKQYMRALHKNLETMWERESDDEEEFDEVQDFNFLIKVTENLKEEEKETVLANIKSSLESRLFLHEIIQRTPEEHCLQPILLLSSIIECHHSSSIVNLDEMGLLNFIDENLDLLILEVEETSRWRGDNGEEREEFERMMETWITTIFLGLNGIYEDEKRQRNKCELFCEESKARKLPKLA